MGIIAKLKKTTLTDSERAELRKLLNETKKMKSVKLTDDEHAQLRAAVESFPTQEKAAEGIGMTRGALMRICLVGSGSEESITHIRTYLQNK